MSRVNNDNEAILSVLLADQLTSDLDILVRINDEENETKLRRADADYVLSLPEMSGRVLAQEVLHGEISSHNRQLKTIRLDAAPFAGETIDDTPIAETDRIVVAIWPYE